MHYTALKIQVKTATMRLKRIVRAVKTAAKKCRFRIVRCAEGFALQVP